MNEYELIQKQLETYRQELPEAAGDCPHQIGRSAKFIEKRIFTETLTIGQMKRQLNIHRHNFAALFEYYMGDTPKQYILNIRMKAAKQLLKNEQLREVSVSTLAFEVGFSGVSTFSKCFKRETGMAPTEWRKKYGEAKTGKNSRDYSSDSNAG